MFLHPCSILRVSSQTSLFSSNSKKKRVARRDLKKRPNRRTRKGKMSSSVSPNSRTTYTNVEEEDDELIWLTSEKRPLVRAEAIESGEDYWIDENDLKKMRDREKAIRNRKVNHYLLYKFVSFFLFGNIFVYFHFFGIYVRTHARTHNISWISTFFIVDMILFLIIF